MQKGARGRGCAGGELVKFAGISRGGGKARSIQRKGRERGREGSREERSLAHSTLVSPSFFSRFPLRVPRPSFPHILCREGRVHLLPRHRLKVPIDGGGPIQRRVFRVAGRAGLRHARGQDRPLTSRITTCGPRSTSCASFLCSPVFRNHYESW